MAYNSFGFELEDVAKNYTVYRPVYPPEIYDKIMAFVNEGPLGKSTGPRVVVDVGCGSGQHTRAIAKYFDTVIGVDTSEAQINEAKRLLDAEPDDKIVYHLGAAENLSSVMGEGTADLVTAACALHWFDPERFYPECLRVLKDGGVFAAVGYEHPTYENAEANKFIHELTFKTLEKYWRGMKGVHHVFNNYRDLFQLMQQCFNDCIRDDSTEIRYRHSLRDFLGLNKSFPHYNYYKADHPEHPDDVDRVLEKLMDIYKPSSIDEKVAVASSPVYLIMGRKP